MEYWEFLLQKEGDQAWLPLESSQVEVLEGRYRIMVHTSHGQTPVQIRVAQLPLGESPAKRRVLKRQGSTNENGLMVVMPFTWLQVGAWDIHCTLMAPDTESSSAAQPPTAPQEYAVQLQVLSQENSSEDDWITDPWADDELPAEPSPLQKLSEATLAAAFQSIDQALADTVTDQEAQAARGLMLSSQYRIELAQSALVARQGALTVVGQVSATNASFPDQALVALRLIDPQTGQVLTTRQQGVFQPASFAIPISLPANLETRLLLGEVALVTPQAQVLAVQRFTVTVDVSSLLDAIANQAESFDEFNIVFPEAAPPDRSSLEEPPTPEPRALSSNAPPRTIPTLLLPRSGLPLPPQIYRPSPHEAATHRPSLPLIDNESVEDPTAEPPSPENDATSNAAPPPATNTGPRGLELPVFKKSIPSPPEPATAPARDPEVSPPPPDGAPDDFKSLNLQDRFWLRLNALAVESQQAARQRQADLEAADLAARDSFPDPPPETIPPPATAEPFAGEFVVYEDEEAAEPAAEPETTEIDAETASETEDEPVSPPTPTIELPEGELVAGNPLPLTLRVPIHFNRLYLKVWITDPQTRTLADEPRQLMHLSPDGYGNLRTTVQFTVPQGCLEAQIEAIAVDLITHQESYKALVRRPVVPDDIKSF